MPRKIKGRIGMPKMELKCSSCGKLRVVQYREPSRRNGKCRHCARYRGGRKSYSKHGWTKEAWMLHTKINGIPNRRTFTKAMMGPLHHNWRGGITAPNKLARGTSEIAEWRLSVFQRDDYTCRICKVKGGNMNAHHILSFATDKNLRHDIDNGVALCRKCHIEVVHKGDWRSRDTLFSYPFTSGYYDSGTAKWHPL